MDEPVLAVFGGDAVRATQLGFRGPERGLLIKPGLSLGFIGVPKMGFDIGDEAIFKNLVSG